MSKRVFCWIAGAIAMLLLPSSQVAAEEILLRFTRGVDIKGEVQDQQYRDFIQCFAYEQAAGTSSQAGAAAGGRTSARPAYDPITIRKKIDKATPLIARTLAQGTHVDAIFLFFRAGHDRPPFYTVEIRDAMIIARKDVVPNTLDPANGRMPDYEDVSFSFGYIKWTLTTTKPDGSSGPPITAEHDVARNTVH